MNREILRLAVPNILSNISVPLLSSFDTALMGGLSGRHIAAVGLGSMAFNFLYWNFGFLRMGSTGLAAQAYGRESRSEMANVMGRALLVAFSIAAILMLLQFPFFDLTVWLLNVQEAQNALVAEYFFIRIWAAPASLGLMAVFGWFFGMQNSVFPLVLTLIVNGANMLLSYYLVYQLGWGIGGVAWGTVAAQYLGLVIGFGLIAWRYAWVRSEINRAALLVREELEKFLSVNANIFIRTLCLTLSFTFFYNRANAMPGEAIVAANVILLQLINWLSYGIDGFAFATESLVGKYHGAGQPERLRRAIRLSFFWGMALAAVYAAVYGGLATPIVRLFADADVAPAVIDTTLTYMPLVVVFCLLATPCYIFDGLFIGLTAGTAMRQTMLIAFGGYLLTYFLFRHYGNYGLWISLTAFMVYRALLQWFWWRRGWVN